MILDDIMRGQSDTIAREKFEELVSLSQVVNIQGVADYYQRETDIDQWKKASEFPNCAPPWKSATYFWRVPRQVNMGGRVVDTPLFYSGCPVAVNVRSKKVDDGFILYFALIWNTGGVTSVDVGVLFCGLDGRVPEMIPDSVDIRADRYVQQFLTESRHGEDPLIVHEPGHPHRPAWLHISSAAMNRADRIESTQLLIAYLRNPVLLAMSLCHCKNVTAEPVEIDHALLKARKKRGKTNAFTRYHVLKIDPMTKALRAAGGTGTGIKQAMHICRGHFKDFRDGRGLFGRYHGLFWWEQMVRGTKSAGEVVKTYEVEGEGL